MADRTIKVLTPADSYALLTLDELKAAFAIPVTDTSQDAALQALIDGYSDVVATMCNRVFAKEKVEETWRGDPPPYENYRVFLARWPVDPADIETLMSGDALVDPANYEVETASGKLSLAGAWNEPLVVTYTGGYDLPEETPPALKQAMQLLIQTARAQQLRGFATGVRSISHKDARVMYFDPNATANKAGTAKGPSIGGDTISALLSSYMRYEV
jgi:hypothetical protein